MCKGKLPCSVMSRKVMRFRFGKIKDILELSPTLDSYSNFICMRLTQKPKTNQNMAIFNTLKLFCSCFPAVWACSVRFKLGLYLQADFKCTPPSVCVHQHENQSMRCTFERSFIHTSFYTEFKCDIIRACAVTFHIDGFSCAFQWCRRPARWRGTRCHCGTNVKSWWFLEFLCSSNSVNIFINRDWTEMRTSLALMIKIACLTVFYSSCII